MHIPVLLNEVLDCLKLEPGKNFIDCTIGGGGHALEILKKTSPNGKILGIDYNPEAIESLRSRVYGLRLSQRVILVCDNFSNLKEIIKKNNFSPVNGILLDLGLSSDLIEKSRRGFSFMRSEVLDMRFNPKGQDLTAAEIINQYSEQELEKIFKEYGGERFSRRVAKAVAQTRKKQTIMTTAQLVKIIKKSLGRHFHVKSLARIFQSLRIVVNNELESLRSGILAGVDVLSPRGRIAVISYQSLEDRIVKNFFKKEERLKILFKKPVSPSKIEIEKNPRSRSAKLRVGERLGT